LESRRINIIKLGLLSFIFLANCKAAEITTGINTGTSTGNNTNTVSGNPNTSPVNNKSPEPVNNSTNTVNQKPVVLSIPADFLQASDVDFYSVVLKWQQLTGVKSFKIFQDGKLIADNLTAINFKVDNLSPQTDYVFEIVAVNEAGESNKSIVKIKTYIPGTSGGVAFVPIAQAPPATSGSVEAGGGYN
jgi:hypothetical protein